MLTTVGQLLSNKSLPPALKDYSRRLTSKSLSSLLNTVATEYPDKYKDVVYDLKKVGDEVATVEGSSFSLEDFKPIIDTSPLFSSAKKVSDRILASKNKSSNQQLAEIGKLYGDLGDKIDKELIIQGLKKKNKLAISVASGSRGKPNQLRSAVAGPVMVMDHKDKPVQVPLEKSYSQGTDPVSYWAASYGTRKGLIADKLATADSGAIGKQLSLAASRLQVTERDCGTFNGVSRNVDDFENIGHYLAKDAGPYSRNTVVTPSVITDLSKRKISSFILRSPLTCESTKGVCQKCQGHVNTKNVPVIGENVGVLSASALSEPLTQGALWVRHSGGVAGGSGLTGGFKLITQLTKIPKVFTEGAALSEIEGKVTSVTPAPQGGTFINVEDRKHYAPPGLDIRVKPGFKVEAGDQLSEGIINPADIVRLKGLGAGRKYLSESLKNAFDNGGMRGIHRNNFETVARALINHVQVENADEFKDGVLPDDIIEYQQIQKSYKPKGVKVMPPTSAKGKFLAKQYLHHTIGSPITNSVIQELKTEGISNIEVTDEPPPFNSVMLRLDEVPKYTRDWQARLAGTNLEKGLLSSLYRAETSEIHGLSPIPGLAYGKEFGKVPAGQAGY